MELWTWYVYLNWALVYYVLCMHAFKFGSMMVVHYGGDLAEFTVISLSNLY